MPKRVIYTSAMCQKMVSFSLLAEKRKEFADAANKVKKGLSKIDDTLLFQAPCGEAKGVWGCSQ